MLILAVNIKNNNNLATVTEYWCSLVNSRECKAEEYYKKSKDVYEIAFCKEDEYTGHEI